MPSNAVPQLPLVVPVGCRARLSWLALLLVSSAALALILFAPPGWHIPSWCVGIAASLVIATALAASVRRELRITADAVTVQQKSILGTKTVSFPPDSLRLSTTSKGRVLSGLAASDAIVRVHLPGCAPVIAVAPISDADAVLRMWSSATRIPVSEVSTSPSRRKAVNFAVQASAWSIFAVIGTVLAWPYATGQATLGRRRRRGNRKFERFQEANALYFRGLVKDAEVLLAKLVKDHPDMVEAHNLLAYAYADQHLMTNAVSEAYKALNLSPKDGMVMDTVAEMHERSGDLSKAVDYYQRALAAPATYDTTETHCKLGRTLVSLNRPEVAKVHLRVAVQSADPKWTAMATELLSKLGEQPKPVPHRRRRQGLSMPIPNRSQTRDF